MHTHARTQAHTLTHSRTNKHTQTLSLSLSLTKSHPHTHTHTHGHTSTQTDTLFACHIYVCTSMSVIVCPPPRKKVELWLTFFFLLGMFYVCVCASLVSTPFHNCRQEHCLAPANNNALKFNEWVVSDMNESCHIYMSHVTYMNATIHTRQQQCFVACRPIHHNVSISGNKQVYNNCLRCVAWDPSQTHVPCPLLSHCPNLFV